MKHAFEDVEVKINAPELLFEQLRRKRKKCVMQTACSVVRTRCLWTSRHGRSAAQQLSMFDL